MPLVALVVLSPSGQFLLVSLSCPMAVHVNLSPSRKRVCHKNQVVPAANHIYIFKKKGSTSRVQNYAKSILTAIGLLLQIT
jgi:hypothetical protein